MAIHSQSELPDDQPIVGQSVHYVGDEGTCLAALITSVDTVDPYTVAVQYFPPNSSGWWQSNVEADFDTMTVGTWHVLGVN